MAATCEERGIKHIKDVFKNSPKSNSIAFMARKPMAPAPPSRTSAGTSTTLVNKTRTNDSAKNSAVQNGISRSTDNKEQSNHINGKSEKGEYFLRANKDKHINAMELPVPAAPTRKNQQPKSSEESENIYLMPSPVSSPVSSPTSPGYNRQLPAPTSPAYSKSIMEPTTPKSPGYKVVVNGSSPVKYPAPPVPGHKSVDISPKSPGYSKAVANFQSPKSPSYSREVNGSYSPKSPPYSTIVPPTSDSIYTHHVEVHNSANAPSMSPIYDRRFDFSQPAPRSPDNETGSLFSGYDTQDPPYNTSPINSPSKLSMLEKTNNSSSALFKKNNKQDKSNRFNKKRHSGDETNSSLAPSSGYHSEFDSELGENLAGVDRSKGHSNLNSSFDEDECTFDFADDDEMYTGGHRYALYNEYEGEDFAKYLDDDGDTLPQYNTTSLARKVQRRRQQYLDKAPRPPKQYTSNPRNKPGLKQRLSQALTLNRTDKNNYVYQPKPLTNIHQFSFMDSKMGNYANEQEIQEYMSRDLETRSDIGGIKKRDSTMPSWHNDTLSMSTLRKAKKLLDQQHQFSNSVPNLHQSKQQSALRASTPQLAHKGESYSDFGADIKRKKKVNRFKFWKIFGKKKDKGKENGDAPSSLGFDEPKLTLEDQHIMDVRL